MNIRIVKLIACGLLIAALLPQSIQADETGQLKLTILKSFGISMNLPTGELQTGPLYDPANHYIQVLRHNTRVFYAILHMQRATPDQSPGSIFRSMIKAECPSVDVEENPLDKSTCPDNIKKIREYRTSHGLRLAEYNIQSTDYICDAATHKYNVRKHVDQPAFMLDLSRNDYTIVLWAGAYPGSSPSSFETATVRAVLDSVQKLESADVNDVLRKAFPDIPLVSQAPPDELKTYRNTTYGFSLQYPALFEHSKLERPDYLTLKLPQVRYPYLSLDVEEYEPGQHSYDKTFEDFLQNQATFLCDMSDGLTSCRAVAGHSIFRTAHGLEVHEYYVVQGNFAGNDCETGGRIITKKKLGPEFIVDISRPGYPMILRYKGPASGSSRAVALDLFDTIRLLPLARFNKEPIQLDWAMRWNSDVRSKRKDIRYFSDKKLGIGMWLPKELEVRSDSNAVRIHRHGKLWASIYRPTLPEYQSGISGPASAADRWLANAAIRKSLGNSSAPSPEIMKQGKWMIPFEVERSAGRTIDVLRIKVFDQNQANADNHVPTREAFPVFFTWYGGILIIPSAEFPDSDDAMQLLWSIVSTVNATTEIKWDGVVPPIKGYKRRTRQLLFTQPTPSNISEIPMK